MARVTAPVSDFTGKVAGTDFVDGVGQTEDEAALAYFHRQGYTVDVEAEDLTEKFATWTETKDFKGATKAQLVAFAGQHDPVIDLGEASTKAEILAVIEAALADDGTGDD